MSLNIHSIQYNISRGFNVTPTYMYVVNIKIMLTRGPRGLKSLT